MSIHPRLPQLLLQLSLQISVQRPRRLQRLLHRFFVVLNVFLIATQLDGEKFKVKRNIILGVVENSHI